MRLSDTEWTVMNAVWTRSPATVRDVLEAVETETGWAYTTVKTILGRLAAKGVLHSSRRANTIVYEPAISRETARHTAVRSLIDRAFDGTFGTLVQHLFTEETLSARDRQRLAAMLDELNSGKDAEA